MTSSPVLLFLLRLSHWHILLPPGFWGLPSTGPHGAPMGVDRAASPVSTPTPTAVGPPVASSEGTNKKRKDVAEHRKAL